ncbi:MAG: DUF423 domain-containing protein [Myxococcota bacterium]
MTIEPRRLAPVAAALGALAVVVGAFGAHGLKAILGAPELAWWQTGAQYHLIHAVVLFAACVAPAPPRPKALVVACVALLAGIALFAGSLYAMALTDVLALGAVTPFGGVGLILGWSALAVAWWPRRATT